MSVQRAVRQEPSTLADMHARKREADKRQAEAAARLERKSAADRDRVARFRQQADEPVTPPEAAAPAAPAIPEAVDAQIRRTLGEDRIARTPRRIIARVAEEYGLTGEDIVGESREALTVKARFAAIAAVRQAHPGQSLPWLGRQFGRDHTTILHALRELGLIEGPAPNAVLAGLVEDADGLRAIAPLALPDLVPSAPPGAPPTFRLVDPSTLLIDAAYQRRPSDKSLKLIRRIVTEWSWQAFKPPIVVEAARGLHVIDGQHTAIGAATHPEISEIPVMVVRAEDRRERAEAFVRHNRDRVQITGMQLHGSLVAAGDPTAVGVEEACRAAGARILRVNPAAGRYGVGDTMAIETLSRFVRRHGVERTAGFVAACVQGELAPITAAVLRAVEMLMTHPLHAGRYEPDALARTFREMGAQLDRKASVYAATNKLAYWQGLVATLVQHTRRRRGSVAGDEP